MKKKFAALLGAVSLVYMVVPEPSDVVPLLGWLDEGVAGAMLVWSMRTLGVTPAAIFAKLRGMPLPVEKSEKQIPTPA
ncbi:MAG: hypothetical protein Q8O67_27805 [Deltaproteobacteria bacterium]|nr:hypothetical protein [Deltaproteobacteria bacterium]